MSLITHKTYAEEQDDSGKIAYEKDDPSFIEIWFKLNPGKTIKDFHIPVHKYNIAKKAIELGANVNYKGWDGTRPIHEAVLNNCYEIAKLLIERGAKVNVTAVISANSGMPRKITPLHDACYKGNLKMVKLLVENGANVNAKNWEGRTPLFYAVESFNKPEVVDFLIKNNAKINIKKKSDGETPLHFAVAFRTFHNVVMLIANKADLSIKNDNGQTPLEFSKYDVAKRPQMVALLEKAATPEVQALIKAGEKEKVIEILTQVEKEAQAKQKQK